MAQWFDYNWGYYYTFEICWILAKQLWFINDPKSNVILQACLNEVDAISANNWNQLLKTENRTKTFPIFWKWIFDVISDTMVFLKIFSPNVDF